MKKLILILTVITSLTNCSAFGQIGNRHYKKFTDTLFNVGDLILAPTILFDLNSMRILPQSYDSVRVIGDFIKTHSYLTIEIGVHTGTWGSSNYNDSLSYRRSETIIDLLISKFNVPSERLKAKGYGKSESIYSDEFLKTIINKDETYRLNNKNFRVEVKILSIG